MDDLVFLKHLDKVVFMNVTEDTQFIENILLDMVNKTVYNTTQDNYFVGFPVQTNINDNRSVTQNTPFYDENTVGTVRFLDEKWVEEFFSKDYIDSMKSNLGRKMSIPESTKYMIITEMRELRKIHCTHVYKYHCEKTMKQKFCNAVIKRKINNRSKPYEIIKADNITDQWLYETAVGLHNCHDWYRDVMDPKKTDQVFALPVAAVAQLCSDVPEKRDDAPLIYYPQHGEGSCGISAFSSAFFYMFDKDLGAKIFSKKKGYEEFKYSC